MTDSASTAEWIGCVVALAEHGGWKIHRSTPNQSNRFANLVLARDGEVLFVFARRDGSELLKGQVAWFDFFARAESGCAVLWRPADLPVVVERLTGVSQPLKAVSGGTGG